MTADHRASVAGSGRDIRVAAGSRLDEAMRTVRSAGGGSVLPPAVLEAIARALVGVLAAADAHADGTARAAEDLPLLDLDETAELLRVSRMTVTRMADEGQLPSIVIRRGKVQKIRRIPRAFVEQMVADAIAGAQVDLEDYAPGWLAELAQERERRQARGGAA